MPPESRQWDGRRTKGSHKQSPNSPTRAFQHFLREVIVRGTLDAGRSHKHSLRRWKVVCQGNAAV